VYPVRILPSWIQKFVGGVGVGSMDGHELFFNSWVSSGTVVYSAPSDRDIK
jgi:hypothetical protein